LLSITFHRENKM